MKTVLLASATLFFAAAGAANAALTVTSIVGGAATGVVLDNLDWLPVNALDTAPPNPTGGLSPQSGLSINFTPNAGAALGITPEFVAPFVSGASGTGFGSANGITAAPSGNQANNSRSQTPYATSGIAGPGFGWGAAVEILLPSNGGAGYLQFGLLWSTIDDYNRLRLFDGATLVGTVNGSDVLHPPNPGGDRPSAYVNITSTVAFDRIVADSTSYAFEFDNLSFTPVPAPGALAVFSVGLLGLAFAARRRSA